MARSFTVDNKDYTVATCTAVAVNAGDTDRQPALYVVNVADSGEVFEFVVYGWKMPETAEDFTDMAEDHSAWDSDHEAVETVKLSAAEREALTNAAGFYLSRWYED